MNKSFCSQIPLFGGNVMLSFCGNYRSLRIASAEGFTLFSCLATEEASKVKDSVAEESNEVPHKKSAAEKDSLVKLTAADEANDQPTKEIAANAVVLDRKDTNAAIAEVSITEVDVQMKSIKAN